jgi:hypothetical protein
MKTHIPTFDEFLNEAAPSPSERAAALRAAEDSIREGIKATMLKLKDDPENSPIHKAKLDVLNAKMTLFKLTQKLAAVTAAHKKK